MAQKALLTLAALLAIAVSSERKAHADCTYLGDDDTVALFGDSNYGGPCWLLVEPWPNSWLGANRNDQWYFHNDWTSSIKAGPSYTVQVFNNNPPSGNYYILEPGLWLPNIQNLLSQMPSGPKYINMNDCISSVWRY
jgi:hypothetical protein